MSLGIEVEEDEAREGEITITPSLLVVLQFCSKSPHDRLFFLKEDLGLQDPSLGA